MKGLFKSGFKKESVVLTAKGLNGSCVRGVSHPFSTQKVEEYTIWLLEHSTSQNAFLYLLVSKLEGLYSKRI